MMNANHKHLVLFVNTRPKGRQDFAGLEVESYELPLLTIKKRGLTTGEHDHQKKLLAGAYRVLVVVSVTAAQHALDALTADDLANLQALSHNTLVIIATGKATACALAQAGLVAYAPSDGVLETSEGVLQMTQIKKLKADDSVLIWRGVGGRNLLVDTLSKKGITVQAVAWYDRVVVAALTEQVATLRLHLRQITIVLLTSQMALDAFVTACKKAGLDHQQLHYIALGDRLTLLAKQHQMAVQTVYELSDDAIGAIISHIVQDSHGKRLFLNLNQSLN